MTEKAQRIADMPALTVDEAELAAFRARDLLWAEVGDVYDARVEEEGLTYAALGRRIGRSRAQVQRWLAEPANMTMLSAGLLAEGLDCDLEFNLRRRYAGPVFVNYAHPCVDAEAYVKMTCKTQDPPTANQSAPASDQVRVVYTIQAQPAVFNIATVGSHKEQQK